MPRDIIVCDTETNGLHEGAVITEVAAINLTTGEEISFAPYVTMEALSHGQPTALQINRYFERGVFNEMRDKANSLLCYDALTVMLKGNVFAGSNPTFDSRLIAREKRVDPTESVMWGMSPIERAIGQVWHHRLFDLSAYAAGVLGIDPGELPGAHKVCELLGVTNEEEHSALGDARATAECFRKLMEIQK